jgi:tRNA pseudouridine55 synthase
MRVIKSFEGEILQAVPRYSAVKLNGKKLYQLAREGKKFSLPQRTVNIYSIKVKKIELPFISLDVNCSKGTYIRSLCRDIGKELNCGGCVWQLRRIISEPFNINQALTLNKVKEMTRETLSEEIIEL